jgi:ribosome-binding factor A
MSEFSRSDRLSSQIVRELSEYLLTFPAVPAGVIITITDVELSKDLRYGKVYYSVLGGEDAIERTEQFFKENYKQLRMELAHKIRIKFMPDLRFLYDKSIERGQRISELLDRIKEDDDGD